MKSQRVNCKLSRQSATRQVSFDHWPPSTHVSNCRLYNCILSCYWYFLNLFPGSLTFPDSEDWEHAVLSLNGPFVGEQLKPSFPYSHSAILPFCSLSPDQSFRNGSVDDCEDFLCFCSPHIQLGMTCEEACVRSFNNIHRVIFFEGML